MKIVYFTILLAAIAFVSCSHKQQESKTSIIDTVSVMVMKVQKCSHLYTAEAHVHKIVTHDDQINLKGSFFKKNFSIHVPGSMRKVAIPMDATIKAYIDFSNFTTKNVNRHGDNIEITLPDPKLVLTSSKINHESVKQFISIARSHYSDAELSTLEQQGRKSIISEISNLDIIEQSRRNAANTLIPMLNDMGFKEENIKVSFRKKFTIADVRNLFDTSTVEKKNISDKEKTSSTH